MLLMVTEDSMHDVYQKLMTDMSTSITISTIVIVILAFVATSKIFGFSLIDELFKLFKAILRFIGKQVSVRERRFHRDLEVGKIHEKRRKAQIYSFLNDLIIDLQLKKDGVTPYSLVVMFLGLSVLISIIVAKIIFDNLVLLLFVFPAIFVLVVCVAYTRANIAHDTRIENIIEAENIISNNIKDGVVQSVKNNIDVLPFSVREQFQNFVDNVEQQSLHVRSALEDLNANLGSTADEFIKKCIVLEMEEEEGVVGMFKDIVEINNARMEFRTHMKRQFEVVKMQFIMGVGMILFFLIGVMVAYDVVLNFYLKTTIGQLILVIDLIIIVGEFVFITYMRAQEL